MNARIVARKRIIGATDGKRLPDAVLGCMGGIEYGPVHEVDRVTEELKNQMIAEFKKLHPTFHNADYEICSLGGRKG